MILISSSRRLRSWIGRWRVRDGTTSVHADMKDERNWLIRDALPQLQHFAVENELQIQLVDLRWGALRDMATDPNGQPVYMEQIDYCRQYSAGPFFAVRVTSCTIPVHSVRSDSSQRFNSTHLWPVSCHSPSSEHFQNIHN